MIKVKVCGITNIEDAQGSLDAGCDGLGFVFFKESRRFITPIRAKSIIVTLPSKVAKVGVFVDAKEKDIRWTIDTCGLDMLQFHGRETPEFCSRFKGYKVIKAFRIRRKRDVRNCLRYDTYAFLFDTYMRSKAGGTGEKFDWDLVSDFEREDKVIFLSGGLKASNVVRAIEVVRPDWVDASSSLESTPGIKDPNKVRSFIEAAKRA